MPSDEQRALWAAIRANPLDDTPRLVYADWLQEHSDETRAEFIRVQIELERLIQSRQPVHSQQRRRLQLAQRRPREEGVLSARSEHLLASNRKMWTEPFVQVVHPNVDKQDRNAVKQVRAWRASLGYRRGFISPLLRPHEVERVIRAGSHLEPIGDLIVQADQSDGNCASLLSVLSKSHLGSCVTHIRRMEVRDSEVLAFASSGSLFRPTSLHLWYGALTDVGACALANSPVISAVTNLHLTNNRIGDTGAIALAESPYLAQIVWLAMDGNPIGQTGWRRLRERFRSALRGAPQPMWP